MKAINLKPIKTKTFTPKEFLEKTGKIDAEKIEKVKVIPADLDKAGLGKIEVTFKQPFIYE